jgi:hypothetical protein
MPYRFKVARKVVTPSQTYLEFFDVPIQIIIKHLGILAVEIA